MKTGYLILRCLSCFEYLPVSYQKYKYITEQTTRKRQTQRGWAQRRKLEQVLEHWHSVDQQQRQPSSEHGQQKTATGLAMRLPIALLRF